MWCWNCKMQWTSRTCNSVFQTRLANIYSIEATWELDLMFWTKKHVFLAQKTSQLVSFLSVIKETWRSAPFKTTSSASCSSAVTSKSGFLKEPISRWKLTLWIDAHHFHRLLLLSKYPRVARVLFQSRANSLFRVCTIYHGSQTLSIVRSLRHVRMAADQKVPAQPVFLVFFLTVRPCSRCFRGKSHILPNWPVAIITVVTWGGELRLVISGCCSERWRGGGWVERNSSPSLKTHHLTQASSPNLKEIFVLKRRWRLVAIDFVLDSDADNDDELFTNLKDAQPDSQVLTAESLRHSTHWFTKVVFIFYSFP